MIGDELRQRATELAIEVRAADDVEIATDSVVGFVTHVQAKGLTPDDRRSLAALYGYELGVDEGALEVANIRRLLVRHGVRECDRHGVHRTTVAMLEEALVARPPVDTVGEQVARGQWPLG